LLERVELYLALLSRRDDLLERLVDVVFCDFLYNAGAEVGVFETGVLCALFATTLLELLDVFVDTHLFAHDALDVDLVWVVVVLDQRVFYGLAQTLGVHGQVLVWNQRLDRVFFERHFYRGHVCSALFVF